MKYLYENRCDNNGFELVWKKYYPLFEPYRVVKEKATLSYFFEMVPYEATYVRKQGIVDYFAAMAVFKSEYVKTVKQYRYDGDFFMTEDERSTIDNQLLHYDENNLSTEITIKRNLIFVLVESFESWTIEYKLQDGSFLMPNLYAFMHENNIFYADKLVSQTKMGVSGDGQMTALTGMLPLITGIACKQFGENNYPNFAHFYPCSITINPAPGVWNQPVVNYSYGIKGIYEDSISDDRVILSKTFDLALTLEQPFFELAITKSSHAPFDKADDVDIAISPEIHKYVAKYMKCMHLFDKAFGQLISSLSSTGLLDNTDIVITGDHTVFKSMFLKENRSLNIEKNYCPLIIYSPSFLHTVQNHDINYQMDIFPTVLGVIGGNSYYWHGFGRNLITGEGPKVPVDIAFKLSDKMIRNDYFRNYRQ